MKYGSDIPGARRLLEQLLQTPLAAEQRAMVGAALGKMRRSPPIRVTPVRNPQLGTPQIFEIVRLADTTSLSMQQIATAVGCNIGRVSEVLQGRR